MQLLEYYYYHGNSTGGGPLVDDLRKNPTYASRAVYTLAQMYHRERKYDEAIATYHEADNPPESLYRIADCQNKQGYKRQAVETTVQIENFFPDQGARASMSRAVFYRDAKIQDKYVAGLRYILSKYPKSAESRTAHVELQKMGVDMGGGVAAEK